jgi:hypothetical protein
VYSLQLNSNFFSTAACGKTVACVGWEQFVYTNQPSYYSGGGNLIIQDWLLSTGKKALKCQAGWITSGSDCYRNAPYSILVPTVPIASLQGIVLSGSATASGDSVFLTDVNFVYGMKNAQNDGLTDLSNHWTATQFNILGDSNSYRAVFNLGTTITISVEAVMSYTMTPKCSSQQSTTAESNNLSFVAAPKFGAIKQYPSILFTESNAGGGGTPSCDVLLGL